MKITISADEFTIGEAEDFEEHTGQRITALVAGYQPTVKELRVLVWIIGRRANPDFTIDDARAMKFSELELATQTPKG